MIARKCKSCGAPLKSIGFHKYICEYCGTLHEDEDDYGNIRVVTVAQKRPQTIVAQYAIPDAVRRIMEPEDLGRLTLQELAESLSKGIAGFMRLKVSDDPVSGTIVRGEVQVIPPDHRLDLLTML